MRHIQESDMKKIATTAAATLAILLPSHSFAQVQMSGTFKASQVCAAVQSIKKGTNADNAFVQVGTSYRLLGKNKDEATHYLVDVTSARPTQRWVAAGCGTIDGAIQTAPSPSTGAAVKTPKGTIKPKKQPKQPSDGIPFYVLALSWEPAFCEVKPDKPECKALTAKDDAASHFSLHGLWPQPRRNVFCGVSPAVAALDDQHQWDKLPEPVLTADTRAALDKVMPGTQSLLQRHEYTKHGTCYPGGSAESYFKDETRLTNAINASTVGAFMAVNVGKTIKTSDLRAKFDEAYGPGAGERVRVSCDGQGRVGEITIGLKGDIPSGTEIAKLIAASSPTDAGCPSGLVDPVN
jgi:ribonuclease T2